MKKYILLLIIGLSVSCYKNERGNTLTSGLNSEENQLGFLKNIFEQKYYYIDSVENVDYNSFKSKNSLISSIVYNKDNYTLYTLKKDIPIIKTYSFYSGYGISIKVLSNDRAYLSYVHNSITKKNIELKKGVEVLSINNIEPKRFENNMFNGTKDLNITYLNQEGDTKKSVVFRSLFSNDAIDEFINDTLVFGKKFTYLLINSFSSNDFSNTLVQKLQGLKSNNLIIDFRDNYGFGTIKNALILLAFLTPKEFWATLILSTKYNKNNSISNEKLDLNRFVNLFNITSQKTVNILPIEYDNLFILTSKNTSSLAELVINSLRSLKNINIIGQKTNGNFLIYNTYTHGSYGAFLIEGEFFDGKDNNFNHVGITPNFIIKEQIKPMFTLDIKDRYIKTLDKIVNNLNVDTDKTLEEVNLKKEYVLVPNYKKYFVLEKK